MRSRKDEILEAAQGKFFRSGFKKTTLEEIAGELGMVKSSIYKHFNNKQELFSAVIDRIANSHKNSSESKIQSFSTAEEKIRYLTMALFKLTTDIADKYKPEWHVWHELRPHLIVSAAKHHNSFTDLVTTQIEKGIADHEFSCSSPAIVSQIINDASDKIFEQYLLEEIDFEHGIEYLNVLIDVLINGIGRKG